MARAQSYRKKPTVVDATMVLNKADVTSVARWVTENGGNATGYADKLVIRTLGGQVIANVGDYVVCYSNGEFSPCKADVFHANFEQVS